MADSKLKKAGFAGSVKWIHNEEGSGAKIYHSSVYFPDSLTNPKTKSGVTIDPGVDMGNCDLALINSVLNQYYIYEVLSRKLFDKIKSAIGYKGIEAAIWIKNYGYLFKNNFMVPEPVALEIMENFTAPEYWNPLIKAMPAILKIKDSKLKAAVHTALLDMSYNRHWTKTILLAKEFVEKNDYAGLAKKISLVRHSLKSLTDRRKREAGLIYAAIEMQDDFDFTFEDLKPLPVTSIASDFKESVLKNLEFEFKHMELMK